MNTDFINNIDLTDFKTLMLLYALIFAIILFYFEFFLKRNTQTGYWLQRCLQLNRLKEKFDFLSTVRLSSDL